MKATIGPNCEVLTKIVETVSKENEVTCDIIDQLREIEADKLYVQAGYSSLLSYCTIELGYSDSAAMRRIRAARLMKTYPQVRQLLRERKLTLTTLELLSKHAPGLYSKELIEEAAGKSKRALIDLFLHRNCPMKRAVRRAERLAKQKGLSAPTKLILDQAAPRTRHIPTQLRDEVYIKDGCRCTYVSPSGVRCTAREQLEIDHIRPFSAGGKTVLGNLRLRCKQHNLLAAEQFYGKEKIEQFRRSA